MSPHTQREIFLSGEGDAWFLRNERDASQYSEADDLLLPSLLKLPLASGPETVVAEIGCGQGLRLHVLSGRRGWAVHGLDPSAQAIAAAGRLGVDARVGTAEQLPYESRSVDLLIFGFCLYLCDRDDLFSVAAEAHRVLKPSGWLAILDFWSRHHSSNPYQHKPGVQSFKSDLSAMFLWHPAYVITDHSLRHHLNHSCTDEPDQWVAATIIRRCDEYVL